LELSDNKIKTGTKYIARRLFKTLEVLKMANNYITDIVEITALTSCENLNQMEFAGNPIAEKPGYFKLMFNLFSEL
jgi:Leucine-rich repeat (LRR) protein